jgi:pimeloyl-ACP methyl ester carboxylesterase
VPAGPFDFIRNKAIDISFKGRYTSLHWNEVKEQPMASITTYLERPEGRIAYSIAGSGPLVVTSPGMGDLRQTWRFLSPALVAAGYRVADADLRGHGDSDTTFSSYGDAETGEDLLALIEHLGGPAVIIGNSMSAGSAVWAATERPDLVRGVVLVGPFVRDPQISTVMGTLMRIALAPPVARLTWNAYLPSLYAGTQPPDFAAYRKQVSAAMRRPGYAGAFSKTTRTSHQVAEERLPQMTQPALIVMGDRDPDFPDPAAEADWIATGRNASIVMVPEAGHYPQAQRPDVVTPAVMAFLAGLSTDA